MCSQRMPGLQNQIPFVTYFGKLNLLTHILTFKGAKECLHAKPYNLICHTITTKFFITAGTIMVETGYQYDDCDHSEVIQNFLQLFLPCSTKIMLNRLTVSTFILSSMAATANLRLKNPGKDMQ